jgi:cytochrome c oxidase subunit 3
LLNNPNSAAFPAIHNAPAAFGTPFLNTIILIASAVFATIALRLIKKGYSTASLVNLVVAILLGMIFFISQAHFIFSLTKIYGITTSSGIFGSLLFFLYGLHTVHVLVGILILTIVFLLTLRKHFTQAQHFGFSAAVWFWNFILVAWLLIFACVYWV